jgi:hypothetical protein
MNLRTILTLFAVAAVVQLADAPEALAADKKFKNLKVLADTGKNLEKGMKNLTKGLGVKCVACHVKGEFESDKVESKSVSREFFKTVVGKKEGRDEALKPLLKSLGLEKLEKPEKFWAGVEKLKLKK